MFDAENLAAASIAKKCPGYRQVSSANIVTRMMVEDGFIADAMRDMASMLASTNSDLRRASRSLATDCGVDLAVAVREGRAMCTIFSGVLEF